MLHLMAVVTPLLLVQAPTPDSIRALAVALPPRVLVAQARSWPLQVREAVTDALVRSASSNPAVASGPLDVAARLAAAYAAAWTDSFLVREVARFAAWPPLRRAAKVAADSVRRAGIVVYGRDGPVAAIAVWRAGLRRSSAIGDTAGMAALLGNIGAGYYRAGQLDSAVHYLGRAGGLATTVGDVRVAGNAVGLLGSVAADRGDLEEARQHYGEALALRRRIGDTRGEAADQNNLGLIAQALGDDAAAEQRFQTALALNRREGRDEIAATNLVNLAGLAALRGDFASAARQYREALATWRDREMWADAADALHGLGQLELRRGDYPAARTILREAVTIYERTGPLESVIAARRQLAGALAAAGDLQGALQEIRHTQDLADTARAPPGVRAGIALARADVAFQLNALADAERLYARAEFLYGQAGDRPRAAEAQHGRALLLFERDQYDRADAVARAALRAQAAAGQRRSAALTRVLLGHVALARGDTTDARRHLARAVSELRALGDPVATAAATAEQGALEAAARYPFAAESLYRAGLAGLGDRVAPQVAWRLQAGLALVLRGRGALDEAVAHFEAATAHVERMTGSLALPERRAAFLTDKADVYAELAATQLARDDVTRAFDASERLRAREMRELLARGRVAIADPDPELAAREQDLRRRIAELTRTIENDAGREELRGPDVSRLGAVTSEALLRAQEEYGGLLLDLRERAPQHGALLTATTVTWGEVARTLAPDQLLVEYLLSNSGSIAFVVTTDTIGVVSLGAGRRDLARLVEFSRGTVEQIGVPGIDSLWRGSLRQLYRHLVAPLADAGWLAGRHRLVLVPHAELHYLPFAALLDGNGRFLVESFEVEETPSATVWVALGARAGRPPAAGVLALAPRTDALPASLGEVASIGRLWGPEARVLTGAGASEERFRSLAGAYGVLHLATYGVLNKHNPMFSFVDLAEAGGHDGRLEVHEVFGLRLRADLVVLSACQTALASGMLADVPPGDDWIGLARAFLHAGAGRVVATLWPVQDRATATLMEAFYGALHSGQGASAALAAAQRALLRDPATEHPFYWAGFTLVGGS